MGGQSQHPADILVYVTWLHQLRWLKSHVVAFILLRFLGISLRTDTSLSSVERLRSALPQFTGFFVVVVALFMIVIGESWVPVWNLLASVGDIFRSLASAWPMSKQQICPSPDPPTSLVVSTAAVFPPCVHPQHARRLLRSHPDHHPPNWPFQQQC